MRDNRVFIGATPENNHQCRDMRIKRKRDRKKTRKKTRKEWGRKEKKVGRKKQRYDNTKVATSQHRNLLGIQIEMKISWYNEAHRLTLTSCSYWRCPMTPEEKKEKKNHSITNPNFSSAYLLHQLAETNLQHWPPDLWILLNTLSANK